ncbi:MAG TPA: DUF3152 domain-containing protein, partial [Euzebya sp.]|nr:DUF3152 domain-containing protein [Euzebya sp.]
AMAADGPTEVVLMGGESVLQPALEEALGTAGFTTTRIAGDTAAEIAVAGAELVAARDLVGDRALVVGPADPLDVALAAAVAAARSRAALVLVAGVPAEEVPAEEVPAEGRLEPVTAAVIGRHQAVLLSTDLPAGVREAVIAAMDPTAVASDDDMAPTAAREAVVVADGADHWQALAASLAAAPGRAVLLGEDAATRWVGGHLPDRVTVVGTTPPVPALSAATTPAAARPAGATATVPALQLPPLARTPAIDPYAPAVRAVPIPATPPTADLAAALRSAWVDGPDRPQVAALVDPGDTLRIALTADRPVTGAQIHVTLLGYEWPGAVAIDGLDATWTGAGRPALPLPLEPATADTPTPVVVTAALVVGERTVHQRYATLVGISPLPTTSPEGWIVAGGSSPVTGDTGLLYTYSVEVEPQTGLDIAAVEAEISSILTDDRSWTGDGAVRLRRVGTSQAMLRVVVATPATVDAFCGAAGLRTGGRVSCWDGHRAMLNLDRWISGVPHFGGDLVTYRQYLVNHEVGHGLAHGHEGCPRPGMLAPIMMQQTGGVGACQPNGWPFP